MSDYLDFADLSKCQTSLGSQDMLPNQKQWVTFNLAEKCVSFEGKQT
mgnify:CR=1 FL=1